MNLQKQPVSRILWTHRKNLCPNNYNPNNVAPPELELLEFSILKIGWVFPILVMSMIEKPEIIVAHGVSTINPEKPLPIIDGFHRWMTSGREKVFKLTNGLVPIVIIPQDNVEMITVMMNRAKGNHNVIDMASIIKTLIERGVALSEIMEHMGMDEEEVFRLASTKGIPQSTIIKSAEFSQSWVPKK